MQELTGTRTRGFRACSMVPQANALPRATMMRSVEKHPEGIACRAARRSTGAGRPHGLNLFCALLSATGLIVQ
jgi:hypothetical protein